jgi:hypothetical protein
VSKRKKDEKQGFIYREAAHGPFVMFMHPNKKVVPLVHHSHGCQTNNNAMPHTSTSTTTSLDTAATSASFHHHHSINTHHYYHVPMLDNATNKPHQMMGPNNDRCHLWPR